MSVLLTLPWPPSVNSYWLHTRTGHTYLGEKGREYISLVMDIVRTQNIIAPAGGLCVEIRATPPDRRVRDCDNIAKAVLDSLTKSGFWEDDYLVDRLTIQRCEVEWPGRLDIFVQSFEE
jgi:crossover junction endodeoxyribonuclease RusA